MRSHDLELPLLYILCFLNQILALSLNMETLISATKSCLSMEQIAQVNLIIGPNEEEEQYLEICQKSLFVGFQKWYLFHNFYRFKRFIYYNTSLKNFGIWALFGNPSNKLKIRFQEIFLLIVCTATPLCNDHPRNPKILVVVDRLSLFRGLVRYYKLFV